MSKTTWGRKETIIWPRHMPIYTYTVAFGVAVLTFLAVCIRIHLATPLQRYCLPAYERSSAFGAVMKTHKSTYRLLFVGGPHSTPRPAMNDDVVLGRTEDREARPSLLRSPQTRASEATRSSFERPNGAMSMRASASISEGVVYQGATLLEFFEPPILGGAILFLILLPVAAFKDVQRQKQLKYGRRLKGPEMLTPQQFNKTVKGDGVGFKTNDMKPMLRIPVRAEAQHMQIIGDTGAGKSALMFQVLRQVQSRGDAAIVYDPAREFVKRFYSPSRGDVILNPLDKRCPYWGPADELRSRSEAKALAASLLPAAAGQEGRVLHRVAAEDLRLPHGLWPDAGGAGRVDVEPGRDRPQAQRDGARPPHRPARSPTASGRSRVARSGRRQPPSLAQIQRRERIVDGYRVGREAARLDLPHVPSSRARSPSSSAKSLD